MALCGFRGAGVLIICYAGMPMICLQLGGISAIEIRAVNLMLCGFKLMERLFVFVCN